MKLKTLATIGLVSASLAAFGQMAEPPAPTDPKTLDAEIFRQLAANPIMLPETKLNEVKIGRVVFSGIAVTLVRSNEPWQLLNPLAPPRYGTFEDSVSRDLITGRVRGIRILSLEF